MAQQKKPGPPIEPPSATAPKKGKGLMIAVIVLVVVLVAAAGGAAWYLMKPKPETAGSPKPVEKPKPAVFVPLETFTVNLQPEGGDHFLQTTFSLKVMDASVEQAIKQVMPEIRSRLLLLLSSKKPSELKSTEGKQMLANQIAAEINRVLNPGASEIKPIDTGKKPENPEKTTDGDTAKPSSDNTTDKSAAASAIAAGKGTPSGPVISVFFTSFIIQ